MKPKPKRKSESNTHPNDTLRLLYFRSIFDLTQKQAADLLGVAVSSYRAYEGCRHPIPTRVRRKIGSLSPVDILPMNPDQDPNEIYAVLRRAQHEEFDGELKRLWPRIAASEQPSGQKHLRKSQPVRGQLNLNLLDISRKNRNYLQAQRREFSPLRRLYCEWRDASFFVSAIFAFLWVTCLQLGIPLGIFTDAANAVGVGSLTVFFLLLAAVLQDMVSDIEKRKTT